MKIEWSELKQVPAWTSLKKITQHAKHLEDRFYKLSDTCYASAPTFDHNGAKSDVPLIIALFWAADERTFRHFIALQPQEVPTSSPPPELLPDGCGSSYGEIVNGLKSRADGIISEVAAYRTDGTFIHTEVQAGRYAYYFRHPQSRDSEIPFLVEFRLPELQGRVLKSQTK